MYFMDGHAGKGRGCFELRLKTTSNHVFCCSAISSAIYERYSQKNQPVLR